MVATRSLVVKDARTNQVADEDVVIVGSGIDVHADAAVKTLNIGTTSAEDINIGRAGQTVSVEGDLDVQGAITVITTSEFQQDATFLGNVSFGDSDSPVDDTVSFANATINSDINFDGLGHQIKNLAAPTDDNDAARKVYVDDGLDLKLDLAGGTMSGAIAMGGSAITGLAAPSDDNDAARKVYVDDADALKVAKAGDTMSGNLAMGSNKVTGLANGTDANDAVNFSQLSAIVSGVSAVSATAPLLSSGGATPDISIDTAGAASGDVLTFDGSAWAAATPEPGAVFAGALTVYVDPVNGTDAPGGGTLGQPYASINYAYSQVTSLGAPANSTYNASVGQFVTEKLIFRLAPGRYTGDVTLGFKRARVQLIGNGVQIVGNVKMSAVRADFPAASLEALKASFPSPWTGVSAQMTFEITGEAGGGVEADTTADPFVVTGFSTLAFEESAFAGSGLGSNWDNNYGQFNFYANKANVIGGMLIATSYTIPTTNGLPTSVIEIDSCTIGEASSPIRTYLGAVPYAYLASPTTWSTGTVGSANKAPTGVITLKCHNSTLGAAIGPRLTIGEIDGCRIYDIDRTMLGTVDNGAVTGSTSTSYLGMVVNQFRVYSGAGIPASQYQIGSSSSGARYKMDSTSYTTLAFSRNSSGVLSARTLNLPTSSGTATAGAATTITDTSKAFTTNQWAGGTITLTGGTGSGQTRTISSNTATAITVSPAWTTNPAAGTTYTVSALVAYDLLDDSRSLAYTPTTGANWLDPDPSTVGSALDRVGALGLLAAAPANGVIPIGNGTNFTPAALTAGTNIGITNGSGSVTVGLTGTVAVANGGTGLTSAPSNGQLLVGNGTGYTLATLSEGTGIEITESAGSITIAATGAASSSAVEVPLTTTGLSSGDVVCVDTAADSKVKKADADAIGTARVLGIVSAANKVQVSGIALANFDTAPSLGAVAYLSNTEGVLTTTVPTSGVVSEVGVVVSAAASGGKYSVLLQVKTPIQLV